MTSQLKHSHSTDILFPEPLPQQVRSPVNDQRRFNNRTLTGADTQKPASLSAQVPAPRNAARVCVTGPADLRSTSSRWDDFTCNNAMQDVYVSGSETYSTVRRPRTDSSVCESEKKNDGSKPSKRRSYATQIKNTISKFIVTSGHNKQTSEGQGNSGSGVSSTSTARDLLSAVSPPVRERTLRPKSSPKKLGGDIPRHANAATEDGLPKILAPPLEFRTQRAPAADHGDRAASQRRSSCVFGPSNSFTLGEPLNSSSLAHAALAGRIRTSLDAPRYSYPRQDSVTTANVFNSHDVTNRRKLPPPPPPAAPEVIVRAENVCEFSEAADDVIEDTYTMPHTFHHQKIVRAAHNVTHDDEPLAAPALPPKPEVESARRPRSDASLLDDWRRRTWSPQTFANVTRDEKQVSAAARMRSCRSNDALDDVGTGDVTTSAAPPKIASFSGQLEEVSFRSFH